LAGSNCRDAIVTRLASGMRGEYPDAEGFYRRNLAFLLRRIPRTSHDRIEEEIQLLAAMMEPEEPPMSAKEAVGALGQLRQRPAELALVDRLRRLEAETIARGGTADRWEMADRICAALARHGTSRAIRAIAGHAYNRAPALGDALARFEHLARLDLSIDPEQLAVLMKAIRELAQSGLYPANCRLLDEAESALTHAGPPGKALLVLGFESAHHPVDAPMDIALEVARARGGEPGEVRGRREAPKSDRPGPGALRENPPPKADRDDPVGAWRHAFLAAPYLRDTFVACGVLSDTFETAITWDRWPEFDALVRERVSAALHDVFGATAELSCRFTHVYPDGPAPYYTWFGMGRQGSERSQWAEVKAAASEAVLAGGGTITHHHAVGRMHRPQYDRQRPELFAAALRAAKQAVDPHGLLNPGVLLDPNPS
jgi:hypothetical protein